MASVQVVEVQAGSEVTIHVEDLIPTLALISMYVESSDDREMAKMMAGIGMRLVSALETAKSPQVHTGQYL